MHVVDNGKGIADGQNENYNDKGKGKEKVAVTSESETESDGMLSSDSDDIDYSNKSFDYLSAGEEELIQLRSRKTNTSKERSILILDMTANPSRTRPNVASKSEVLVEHEDFLTELV